MLGYNFMTPIYADLVRKGKKKYPDDIPASLQEEVKQYMDEAGWEIPTNS